MKYFSNMQTVALIFLILFSAWIPFISDIQAADTGAALGEMRAQQTRADYDFTLKFESDSQSFNSGSGGVILSTLENLGTLTDSYILEIKQVPVNWTITFYNAETVRDTPSIAPGNSKVFDLFVSGPETGEAYIALKATSKNASSINHTAFISLIIKKPILQIDIDSDSKTVIPGDFTTFSLKIKNLQEISENVTVSLIGTGIISSEEPKQFDWTYKLNLSRHIQLKANSTTFVSIIIQTPLETVPDDQGDFNIEVLPESNNENPFEERITVKVLSQDLVEAELKPPRQTGKPGETLDFTVTLFNNGTTDLPELSLFQGELPPAWEYVYNATTKFSLDRHEVKNINIQVIIPEIAKVGNYKLPMNIWAEPKSVGNFSAIVEVSHVPGLELENSGQVAYALTGELRYEIDWKKPTEAEFILRNSGNGIDTVTLNFSNVPDNWQVYFKSITPTTNNDFNNVTADFSNTLDLTEIYIENQRISALTGDNVEQLKVILESGMAVRVVVTVNTSDNQLELYLFNFTVNAFSSDISVMNAVLMEMFLVRSGLVIESITLSRPVPRVDEQVVVSVTIRNDYHSATENFTARFIVNDKSTGSKNIDQLAINDTAIVEFEWTPVKKGLYSLDIELEGAMVTPGTEPEKRRNVTVEEKAVKKNGESDNLIPIILVIAVMLVFSALAVVMLYISRKKIKRLREKRKNDQKQKQEENGASKETEPKYPSSKDPRIPYEKFERGPPKGGRARKK
jgi:uncharacterized repeat protein (TIGR01451 family)